MASELQQPSQVTALVDNNKFPTNWWFNWFIKIWSVLSFSGLLSNQNANLPGISVTITTAKLTGGGANGSMTFTNGILTSQTQAT